MNAACDKAVYRIDVGLSKGCGDGHPEVRRRCDGCKFVRAHTQLLRHQHLYRHLNWAAGVCRNCEYVSQLCHMLQA